MSWGTVGSRIVTENKIAKGRILKEFLLLCFLLFCMCDWPYGESEIE